MVSECGRCDHYRRKSLFSQAFQNKSPVSATMQILSDSAERTFGYLTAVQSPEYGYFGGFLIVSVLGRPLEFHCTAPIRPSRAQEILYGPTLQPYLLGEQICGALLGKAKLVPSIILTDHTAVLQARARATSPIVLVTARDMTQTATSSEQIQHPLLAEFEIEVPPGYEAERDAVVHALTEFAGRVKILEPFGRIQEAIREVQRIGARSASQHDQAA